MYFGLSFGRIGSDFRSLLVPLFSQVVYDRFELSVNKSESQFAEAMSSFSPARSAIGSNIASSIMHTPQSSVDQVQPPYTLIQFSPLAELCNGLIAAFNELRMCAPVQLVVPVVRKLERTLCNCSQILSDFHRQEKQAFTANEELEFDGCLQLYRNEFLTYVQKVLLLMFPPSLISAQTGFSIGEITKQELCGLDKDSILQPIAHLFQNEQQQILLHPKLDADEQTHNENSSSLGKIDEPEPSIDVKETVLLDSVASVLAEMGDSNRHPVDYTDQPLTSSLNPAPVDPLPPVSTNPDETPADNEVPDEIPSTEVKLDMKYETENEVQPHDSLLEENSQTDNQLQNPTNELEHKSEPQTSQNCNDSSEPFPSEVSEHQDRIDPVVSTEDQEEGVPSS